MKELFFTIILASWAIAFMVSSIYLIWCFFSDKSNKEDIVFVLGSLSVSYLTIWAIYTGTKL